MEFIFLICSYLVGSVPFGLVFSKIFGKGTDIRLAGSGNIGATNAVRVFGKKIGFFVFLFDGLKGLLFVLLAYKFFNYRIAIIGGFLAIFGHIFSVFLKFKGGKGVSTALFVIFGLDFWTGIFISLIWLIVFLFTRYSSLSAVISIFVGIFFLAKNGNSEFYTFLSVVYLLILKRHFKNIEKLVIFEENKF